MDNIFYPGQWVKLRRHLVNADINPRELDFVFIVLEWYTEDPYRICVSCSPTLEWWHRGWWRAERFEHADRFEPV
jgi:hypothetical protein